MNMHCLVAVARCRVQTRRYHCLINHTQSQRPTLHVPSSRAFYPLLDPCPVPRSHHPARESAEDSPCHPSGLSLRVSSRCVSPSLPPSLYLSFYLYLSAFRDAAGVPYQAPAIDTNLRNFFGPSTCHRVTAHPRPGVPDLLRTAVCRWGEGEGREGVRFTSVGYTAKRGETSEVETIESPGLGEWSSAANVAILGTLIERINRERAGHETERVRARAAFFAFRRRTGRLNGEPFRGNH